MCYFLCDWRKNWRKDKYGIAQQLTKLGNQDTLQLVLEAETEEERDFFEMIGTYLLQKEQVKVIERNLL